MKIRDDKDEENVDATTNAEDEREKALKKREYVLRELIETENDYVENLRLIVEGYIQAIRNENADIQVQIPEDLKNGKEKIIFGNIEAIYEWHKECVFCHLIRHMLENLT